MSELWKIDRALIERLTEISRLGLTEEELEKFSKQLRDVLEAFREIDRVDTSDVEPSYQPIEIKNVLRDDQVVKWVWNPLSNTVHREKGYFKGPRIV